MPHTGSLSLLVLTFPRKMPQKVKTLARLGSLLLGSPASLMGGDLRVTQAHLAPVFESWMDIWVMNPRKCDSQTAWFRELHFAMEVGFLQVFLV